MALPESIWSLSRGFHSRGLKIPAKMLKALNHFLHKCLLPAEAVVGENLRLDHYALGVVMHPNVKIGNHCRIFHHVTLASESIIGADTGIVIEEGVVIGAHSIVVARANQNLTIGKGSIIGAGSVVTKDVPEGEIWAGNPAKFLKRAEDRVVVWPEQV